MYAWLNWPRNNLIEQDSKIAFMIDFTAFPKMLRSGFLLCHAFSTEGAGLMRRAQSITVHQ